MKIIKNLVNALNIAEYIGFILATIFVLVFQFVGLPIFVILALVLYTLAFLIVFAISVIQCKEYFDATKNVKVANPKNAEVKEGEEVVNIKHEKTWAIIKAVSSGVFAIFTLIVLILY